MSRPERIVALIDDRLCSMATVRHAVDLVKDSDPPLLVMLRLRRPAPFPVVGDWPVVMSTAELEAESFRMAANLLAPSGVGWNFHSTYDVAGFDPVGPARAVIAEHRPRWWPRHGQTRWASSRVTVACDRSIGGAQAHERTFR